MATDNYIDLETAAQRSGKSIGHLRRLCSTKWAAAAEQRRVEGQKAEWFVREDADVSLARVKFPEQIGTDLRSLTDKKRAEACWRLDVLKRWHEARKAGVPLGFVETQITSQFLTTLEAREGKHVSRATLYGWEKKYRRGGLAALADERGVKPADAPKDDPFFEEVKRLYLNLRRRKLTVCYEIAIDEARRQGWQTRSYATVHRLIGKLPKPVVDKLRYGEEEFTNESMPYIERDYSALRTNEMWCSDHHQLDVVVNAGGAYGLVRPWLTAWQDMRSRRIVGWRIFAHTPNQDTILLAFADAVRANGVPRRAYMDNGKDYDCYALNGRTKADRWRKQRVKVEVDAAQVGGLFGGLGVDVTHCQPYHGQSKPIERFFGTVCARFSNLWQTYCGSSPAEKPEDLQLQLERGAAPTMAAFVAAWGDWLAADYNGKAGHQGDGMEGRSPDEVFAASWGDHAKRTTSEAALTVLLMKVTQPVKVTQNGVRWNGLNYGQTAEALWALRGREVFLRVDPADVSRVTVWSLDGRFVCAAAANLKLPANASSQELREAMHSIKGDRKKVKEYHEARPKMGDHPVDRVLRARAARNAEQPAGPVHPAPHISPVRTAFDDQLPALQRAMERHPTRAVVGAESVSFGDLGDKLGQRQNDASSNVEDPFARLGRVLGETER